MYKALVARVRYHIQKANFMGLKEAEPTLLLGEAADAIEELQATLCNWCAVCPKDKRDLSTCEIYESCRAKPPKEE